MDAGCVGKGSRDNARPLRNCAKLYNPVYKVWKKPVTRYFEVGIGSTTCPAGLVQTNPSVIPAFLSWASRVAAAFSFGNGPINSRVAWPQALVKPLRPFNSSGSDRTKRRRSPARPALSRLAQTGDPQAFKLPRPLLHSGDLDFSFAGLKTAVMTQARKLGEALEARKADLAASTQAAIVEVLVKKSMTALRETGLRRLVVAGGVGANQALRQQLNALCQKQNIRVHYPELHLCTDNGAMIAMAAAMRLQAGVGQATTRYAFDVKPRWPLAELQA